MQYRWLTAEFHNIS